MSGGVDSSTVAAMLRADGFNVVGLTMQLWNQRRLADLVETPPQQAHGRCCSLEDVYDARRVAETIGIPYYVVNQEARFEREVVRPFVEEYLAGRTPIPCSLCNNHLKFDQLLITARQIGAEKLATGHYARCEFGVYSPTAADGGSTQACGGERRWLLKRAVDTAKDQTYFLFGLTQDQLSRTWFPLGDLCKAEVRQRARQLGLALADKPDSQEICFIPDGNYRRFIAAYLEDIGETSPVAEGEMVTTAGQAIGRHAGVHQFTVGQRKGLRVASPTPLYVIQVDGQAGRVVVGPEEALWSRILRARKLNWIAVDTLREPARVAVKIRHKHTPAMATVEMSGADEVLATFDEPQRAITPGQAAVFYDGDIVVGGGWICQPLLK
jgi:tRNA-specific 2-thiouridylase